MAPTEYSEFYERTPLIASVSIASLSPQGWWHSWKGYLQAQRHTMHLYLEEIRHVWPLVWPSEEEGNRYRLYLCGVIFLSQRILYVLVPYLLGRVVYFLPLLNPQMLRTPKIWVQVFGLYASGFVRDYLCKRVQSWLWLPCSLRSEQVISRKTLQAVLDNPEEQLRWASGGFLSDFNKGGSLNKCLEEILFTWIPLVLDLVTTTTYIWLFLGPLYGLVIAGISSWYVYSIACNAQRSVCWSREVVEAKRMKDAVANSVLSAILDIVFQNGIATEISRFKTAQDAWQSDQRSTSSALIFQGILQDAVFQVGFFVMSVLTICQIAHGQRTAQHFVNLFMYMNQLHVPLNSLSASVQNFLKAIVNTERLLVVLKEFDKRGIGGALEMTQIPAAIEFECVAVGTARRLSFHCLPKTTTVILGVPAGERFFFTHPLFHINEAQIGVINIAGRDVRHYSTGSLRRNVGLIPQDCKLLDDTILECLKYGLQNPESIDYKSVFAACQAVNIHNTIQNIPGGYNARISTKVYSLGREERRRLALARLLLQNSRILVFDGAIATLEGEEDTELCEMMRKVLCQRTVLVIDYNTAAEYADQILFLRSDAVHLVGQTQSEGSESIGKHTNS